MSSVPMMLITRLGCLPFNNHEQFYLDSEGKPARVDQRSEQLFQPQPRANSQPSFLKSTFLLADEHIMLHDN